MTNKEIKNILKVYGEKENTWITLEGKARNMFLLTDNNIYIDPIHTQFYFDTSVGGDNDCGLMYSRYTSGNVFKKTDNTVPDGYCTVAHNGEDYLLEMEKGGVETVLNGEKTRIHDIISTEIVTSFIGLNM